MVRSMVTSDRIDEGHVPDKPIVINVTTEMEDLIKEIVTNHCHVENIACIGVDQPGCNRAQYRPGDSQNNEHSPWEEDNAKLTNGVNGYVIVSEILMMVSGVSVINRPQSENIDFPMHYILVHRPLNEVTGQEYGRDEQPFPSGIV
jgi:hypothetical protein